MQEAVKKQIDALAFSVALNKSMADGAPPSRADFDALMGMVASELERVVNGIGAPSAPAPKRPRPVRKASSAAEGAAPSPKPSGINPEALRAYLTAGKATLQQVAERFGVSKAVAQRAVVALGDSVKDEPGTKPEGQRGKAPTVYWLE